MLNSPMHQPTVAAAHLVDRNVPCPHCNSNLRGMPTDSACRKCGFPVVRTVNARTLVDAPERLLVRVQAGLRLIPIAISLMPLCVLLGLSVMWLGGPNNRFGDAMFIFMLASPLISLIALMVAGWVVTTRRLLHWDALTRPTKPIAPSKSRALIRPLILFGAAGQTVWLLLLGLWRGGVISLVTFGTINTPGTLYIVLLYIAALQALILFFVRWLAARLPSPKLAATAFIVAVLCIALTGIGMVTGPSGLDAWVLAMGLAQLLFVAPILALAIQLRFVRNMREEELAAIRRARLRATAQV